MSSNWQTIQSITIMSAQPNARKKNYLAIFKKKMIFIFCLIQIKRKCTYTAYLEHRFFWLEKIESKICEKNEKFQQKLIQNKLQNDQTIIKSSVDWRSIQNNPWPLRYAFLLLLIASRYKHGSNGITKYYWYESIQIRFYFKMTLVK